MTHAEALKLLELVELNPSMATIKAAWARKVHMSHPDKGGAAVNAPRDISKLTEARNILLDALSEHRWTCKTCRGSGMQRGRIGSQSCVACSGTGESKR